MSISFYKKHPKNSSKQFREKGVLKAGTYVPTCSGSRTCAGSDKGENGQIREPDSTLFVHAEASLVMYSV